MWKLDDVPEDDLDGAPFWNDCTRRRIALWPPTVARLLASKNTPPLVRAIVGHDAGALAEHLDEESRREAVGPGNDPMTPLHYAVLADDAAAVEALLAAGADPDERTGEDQVPLILEAIAHASRPVLQRLLPLCNLAVSGPARRALPPHAWALHRREKLDTIDVVEELAARGVDCTACYPPALLLHDGARRGQLDLVRWCLARGMPADLRWRAAGPTPLYEAASRRRPEIVDELLRAGADVRATSMRTGVTALHAVASASDWGDDERAAVERIVDCLLAHGLTIDVRDGRGQTPLHAACFVDDVLTATVLLARGASCDARDDEGRTPVEVISAEPRERREALRALMAGASRRH